MRARLLWWAVHYRLKRDVTFVVAVGGAIAKTSTKTALGYLFEERYPGHVRVGYGNLNSYLGVPLAIFGFELDFYARPIKWGWPILLLQVVWVALTTRLPRYLILEFGTDGPGDVEAIVKQIQPDVSVLTIVGPAHLANYPSEEAMAHDEGWLVEATRSTGHVFLNSADPYLENHVRRTKAKVVTVTTALELMAVRYAESVGQQLGFEKKTIDLALANYQPPEHRLQEKTVGSFLLLDDSYNASPLAMQAALRRLQKLPGRHVAVLGAMLELGPKEVDFHREVGQFARAHADIIIGVGDLARHYEADHWFATSAEAAEQLFALLREGDTILVKGSKATKMEKIISALKKYGSA